MQSAWRLCMNLQIHDLFQLSFCYYLFTAIRSHFIIVHAVPTLMMQCQFGCSVSHSNRDRRHALYSELNFVWLKRCCDCLIHLSVRSYEIIIRLHSLCSLILVFIRLPRAWGCCTMPSLQIFSCSPMAMNTEHQTHFIEPTSFNCWLQE